MFITRNANVNQWYKLQLVRVTIGEDTWVTTWHLAFLHQKPMVGWDHWGSHGLVGEDLVHLIHDGVSQLRQKLKKMSSYVWRLYVNCTCRLFKSMHSCSMEEADTMTHWLVLFLRLQARISCVREASSLSEIYKIERLDPGTKHKSKSKGESLGQSVSLI